MFSAQIKLLFALAAAVLVLRTEAQPCTAENAECLLDDADVFAGCGTNRMLGECMDRFGELRCIAVDDDAGTNGNQCGAVDGECVCVSGICIESDISDVCDSPGASGDPHLIGLKGQKFDFTGQDQASYNLMHDGKCNVINMRVTALPGTPVITYITGMGMRLCGDTGEPHTITIQVNHPHILESACPSEAPCLADGAITVKLDGRTLDEPGEYSTNDGLMIAAANIPGECRPFGFEKYWLRKQQEAGVLTGRRLRDSMSMSEWIMRDKRRTNPVDCMQYIEAAAENDSLFEYQSEHTSFQITTPAMSLRVNHGKIHQLAMRDPTDTIDLPDHIAFQMNVVFEKISLSRDPQGVIGETTHPVVDDEGNDVMKGLGAIRGEEEAYRVGCLLCDDFPQLHA